MVEIIYEAKKYRFTDLSIGDTFIDVDGDLMMKIEAREMCRYNCIMLADGGLYSYDDDNYVDPVNCRIEVLNK